MAQPPRKRHRIDPVSEDESDDSPVVASNSRGCRPLETDESDDESAGNWTSDETDDDTEKADDKKSPETKVVSRDGPGWQSDSSDGDYDKCPVCLLKFSGQEIGTPDTCDHIFCSDCLIEWSNHVNTCPVDRKEFASVVVREKIGGEVVKKIPVKPRRISLDYMVEEQPTICQICQSGESEETMLLCDMCDLGFHMECLSPPLEEIPLDDWYCPTCSTSQMNQFDGRGQVSTPGTTSRRFAQSSSSSQRPGLHSADRTSADNSQDVPSTSSQSRPTLNSAGSSRQRSRPYLNMRLSIVKKSSRKKRKKRKSKKMVIVEYDISNGQKFPTKTTYVIKKRKKRVKRRVPRTVARRSLVRASVKGHIANLMKSSGLTGSRRDILSSLAVPRLSIFGDRNELDVQVSDDEDVGDDFGFGRTAVASAPRVFSSAILDARRQSRRKAISIPSPTHESTGADILSSIMECQTLLHSKNASMDVKEDGSIVIQKKENDILSKPENKIDVQKPDSDIQVKETPSYGSGGRGGGGNWRGSRDYQGGSGNNRGGQSYSGGSYQSGGPTNYWDGNNYNNSGGDYGSQGNSFFNSNNPWNNNSPRNQREQFSNFQDRSPAQRNNANNNRGRGQGGNQPRFSPHAPQRMRGFTPWQQQNVSDALRPYSEPSPEMDNVPEQNFANQSNVLSNQNLNYSISEEREPINNFSESKPLGVYHVSDERLLNSDSLPQPPIIRFKKPTLSDDEKSDSDKAPDEDKYDPMEPTIDDSSDDEGTVKPRTFHNKITIISPPRISTPPEENEEQNIEMENELSNSQIDESSNVSPKDHDVQPIFPLPDAHLSDCLAEENEKDVTSDGEDCPNFSIYSSTSMDIAKNKKAIIDNEINQIDTSMDDLVQQDDSDEANDCEAPPIETNPEDTSKVTDNKATEDVSNRNIHDNSHKGNDEVVTSEAVSTRAKFLPKRNMIKINLSSNFGIKKRLIGTEPDKEPAKSPDRKATSSLETAISNTSNVTLDFNAETNSSQQISLEMDNFGEFASDPEDERSYTPCLDENKSVRSKDTSLEDNDKGNSGFEGLDTEMISEDEGNELFSDPNNPKIDKSSEVIRETELPPGDCEEGEIIEKNKQKIKAKVKQLLEAPDLAISDEDKKKKRREKRTDKDDKDKGKSRSKKDLDNFSFKKLSKSGKERNYRERDDKNRRNKDKRRSKSVDNKENKDKKDRLRDRRREKRKDMERYDVRNVISDKSRRLKDAFGRDKSRPKSNSPDSRVTSPSRYRRSLSHSHRSASPNRAESISRNNRSISKDNQSKSPKQIPTRRLSSAHRTRASSVVLRSASREPHSPSNRNKKSVSPRRRSPSPKARKSVSPRRRSISPRPRSPVQRNRRSISPKVRRSKSPRHRRSLSRNRTKRIRRSLSRNRRVSPRLYRPKSPRRRIARRSRSHSRNRSRSPKLKKVHKVRRNRSNSNPKSKSPVRQRLKRKRSRSINSAVALSRSLSRERLRHQQWQEEAKSPLYQDWSSDSRSLSPAHISPSWTPPPMEKSPQPQNLRVILTNKEKNKKKDKKKKSNKRNKMVERITKHQPKDLGPSKEVFTSGNNILVSVSFNKNKENDNAISLPPPDVISKRKKRKTDPALKQKKDKNREKIKKRRIDKEKRSKEIENKKPVAIIDLDKSPFKELTPSPKAVIVLSDSDNGEKEEELIERQEIIRGELSQIGFPQPEVESLPNSPNRESNYVTSTGPKTPPEPPIKFTIISKSNPQLRAINPLHEEEDEEEVNENAETEQPEEMGNRLCEVVHKGPNTPPEPPNSPPSSPDAYDPFEPTKSGSATPEQPTMAQSSQAEVDKQPETKVEEISHITCMSLEAAQKSNLSADDVIQSKPISPTEKVMALLKSTRANASPANTMQALFSDQTYESLKTVVESEPAPVNSTPSIAIQSPNSSTILSKISQTQCTYSAVVKPTSPKPVCSTVAPTVVTSTPLYLNPTVPRIGVYSMGTSPQRTNPVAAQKITLPSPTKASPLKTQPSKLFLNKPSPIKSTPIKPMQKTIISKLPMPTVKPLPARVQKTNKNANKSGQNGNDIINLDMDMDSSPYSPGSSDFCDLFEPPSDNGKHGASAPYTQKSSNKFDSFDNLFTLKPSQKSSNKSSSTKVSVKQMKKSKGKTIVGVKMDEDSLKILDDLPSSAVEMQVKSKFLKKLNRQERVVEEVKLVLKPHYTKKHINKEEYKDILRRAVPKICHNRSGEINPAKIQALIEAYVKKFRKKAHLAK